LVNVDIEYLVASEKSELAFHYRNFSVHIGRKNLMFRQMRLLLKLFAVIREFVESDRQKPTSDCAA